jgi:hypothetical protein
MYKKIAGGIAILAVAAIAALNMNVNNLNGFFRDISLSDIEALALQEYLMPASCNSTTPTYIDSTGQVILLPASYGNNKDCYVRIAVPNLAKNYLRVTVTCSTELDRDFLTVYAVDDTWNILSTELCISGSKTVSIVTSGTNGKLLLRFKSDGTISGANGYGGFVVQWELCAYATPDLYTNNGYFAGKVGIGTTSPLSALHVEGDAYIPSGKFYKMGSSTASRLWLSHTSSSGGVVNYAPNLYFKSGSSAVDAVAFLANGNVGIGTSNPDQKLTVKGKIHAEEVILDANVPFPDYVFSPWYNLMPLKEVEKFVKENNHLPDIPSAGEVAEKGLGLGEMQIKLLQKIEELTLHAIEQGKAIEELKKEINELKDTR